MKLLKFLLPVLPVLVCGCEYVDHSGEEEAFATKVSVDSVARLLSYLPLGPEQVCEVHDAVTSSSANGYDEEYMMKALFTSPGAGVGDDMTTRASASYQVPIRDLIREHLSSSIPPTRAGGDIDEYMKLMEDSGLQIYWPYSEEWDGESLPVITFDPSNGAEVNVGYRIRKDGFPGLEEVIVDEDMAMSTPVWVVNRNDDSGYTSVEMLRRQNPDWAGGGSVIVKPSSDVRTLVLKDFTMRRNFDPWFAGASEFFVKCGRVEDFTASTEAELKLYSPQISDFMIVVKRNQVNKKIPFNVVLVSQWTEQNESIAFMIVEDDGGTRTEWKCSAVVKYNSKSYGFEVSLPFNSRDDIVWRGQLTGKYLEKYDGMTSRFGDVELTFQFQ
ncbi:MAG: hypothetical protein ACI3ZC_07915 [Candidatus Cryptobacteroides sp.]